MNKRILMVGVAIVALLFTSCRKEDMELLKHGYRVQGEVSPSFEVPVSSGEMTLDDLLTKLGGSLDGYVTNDTVITFKYEMLLSDTIDVGGMMTTPATATKRSGHKPLPSKTGTPLIEKDTLIQYSLPIDFFSQVDLLQENDISIGHLWLNLDALVQGFCPENVRTSLQKYCWISMDSLAVQYDGKHGHQDFGVVPEASILINDITADNRLAFDSVNLADIINSLPTQITVMFRMHLFVDEDFATDGLGSLENITYFQELLDSLKMTRLVYGANIGVNLPFEIHIGALAYSYQLDFGQQSGTGQNESVLDQIDGILTDALGEGSITLDSSALTVILRFNNGIPLNIDLTGTLLDANGMPLLDANGLPLMLLAGDRIASAQTAPVPGTTGVSQAVAPTRSEIAVELTMAQAKQFLSASSLRLDMLMTTDGTDSKRIRRTDNLKMDLLVKINPNIKIDYEVPLFREGIL